MNLFTFSNPSPYPALKSVYWANGATLHRVTGKTSGATREDMLRAAVQIAFEAVTIQAPLIVLDHEATAVYFPDPATSYTIQAEMAQVIRAECGAAIPITSYAASALCLYSDRDQEIALAVAARDNASLIAALGTKFTITDPLMRQLDCVNVPAYLMGPTFIDRDINFMWAAAKMLETLYPGKKLIYSLWGIYHPSFNPPNTVPATPQLTQYAYAAQGAGDAWIIFDPESKRDDAFVGMLGKA